MHTLVYAKFSWALPFHSTISACILHQIWQEKWGIKSEWGCGKWGSQCLNLRIGLERSDWQFSFQRSFISLCEHYRQCRVHGDNAHSFLGQSTASKFNLLVMLYLSIILPLTLSAHHYIDHHLSINDSISHTRRKYDVPFIIRFIIPLPTPTAHSGYVHVVPNKSTMWIIMDYSFSIWHFSASIQQ